MRAFSLIELSIVLVILGLLTGGILTGQSLIRAAELRAVNSEFSRYVTATQTFRDKYIALPGDMNNATRFWFLQVSGSGCTNNSSASVGTPGACDGDGDGTLEAAAAVSQSGEIVQFWRQLANAGLIEGSYSGLVGSGGVWHMPSGSIPASKLGNGYWGASNSSSPTTGDSGYFNGDYGNLLVIGSLTTNTAPITPLLKAEEAWNIDTKLDDGKPATGKIVVRSRVSCATASDGSALTSSAADAAKTDAVYALSSTGMVCVPVFRTLF